MCKRKECVGVGRYCGCVRGRCVLRICVWGYDGMQESVCRDVRRAGECEGVFWGNVWV